MATYFVEFYAEKKPRAIFIEYKPDVTDKDCQDDIRKIITGSYPDARIHTIAKQNEKPSNVQLKLEEAPF